MIIYYQSAAVATNITFQELIKPVFTHKSSFHTLASNLIKTMHNLMLTLSKQRTKHVKMNIKKNNTNSFIIFSGKITIPEKRKIECVCLLCTNFWNSNATVPNWRLIAHKLNMMIFVAMMSSSSLSTFDE